MYPAVRTAAAKSAGLTAATTITAPGVILDGDLEFMVASCDTSETIAITSDGGGAWTALTGSPYSPGGSGDKLYVWYRVRASGDGNPQLTASLDHVCATRFSIAKGTFDPSSPIEAVASGSEGVSDSSFSFAPGTSTSGRQRRVFCITTTARDSNVASTGMPMANASLSNLASVADYCTANNTGGGFGITTGTLDTAAGLGTFTSTYAANSLKAFVAFAIKRITFTEITAGPNASPTLDDFNRANEGPPPSASWTDGIGELTVRADRAAATDPASVNGSARRNVALSGKREVWMQLGAVLNGVATTSASIWLNSDDGGDITGTGYILTYDANAGTLTLSREYTTVPYRTTLATMSQTLDSGDALALAMEGSGNLRCYRKPYGGSWTLLSSLNATDSTYTGAMYPGMNISDVSKGQQIDVDVFGGGSFGERTAVKSGGAFATNKPVSYKSGGSFAAKPTKVKVGGTFI